PHDIAAMSGRICWPASMDVKIICLSKSSLLDKDTYMIKLVVVVLLLIAAYMLFASNEEKNMVEQKEQREEQLMQKQQEFMEQNKDISKQLQEDVDKRMQE